MGTLSDTIARHPQFVITALTLVILVMVTACVLNEVIPICHYVFGCDHRFH
jgi:hypothetical protein